MLSQEQEIRNQIRDRIENKLKNNIPSCSPEPPLKSLQLGKKLKGLPPDAEVDIPVYHGIRFKNPQDLLRKGFCISTYEMRENIKKALDHFNIQVDKLTPLQKELLDTLYKEMEWRKDTIWAALENVCDYAKRNPEHVLQALNIVGIPDEKIIEYIEHEFGKPYRLKLKIKPKKTDLASGTQNIRLNRRCIYPEDIEEVCACE